MIDIHSHVIPEFDDGSRSLEESIRIAELESRGGTRTMFATPHVLTETDIENSAQIGERVAILNEEFKKRSIELTVIPGAELFPSMAITRGLRNGKPISLGGTGKYVLLDLPHSVLPVDFDTILFEILASGVTPILAHPERCPVFQPNPELTLDYVERGVIFQINVGSFMGRHGAQANDCAKKLFQMRVPHFIASDAHRAHKRSLGDVVAELTAKDPEYVKILTQTSGQAVIDGAPLPEFERPEYEEKKPSIFARLFGR